MTLYSMSGIDKLAGSLQLRRTVEDCLQKWLQLFLQLFPLQCHFEASPIKRQLYFSTSCKLRPQEAFSCFCSLYGPFSSLSEQAQVSLMEDERPCGTEVVHCSHPRSHSTQLTQHFRRMNKFSNTRVVQLNVA